jgi:hypothetical protein
MAPGIGWGHIRRNCFYMSLYRKTILKIFSRTTGPKELNLHESSVTFYKRKFVKIMALGGRVGTQ